jgi:hypothetical protein
MNLVLLLRPTTSQQPICRRNNLHEKQRRGFQNQRARELSGERGAARHQPSRYYIDSKQTSTCSARVFVKRANRFFMYWLRPRTLAEFLGDLISLLVSGMLLLLLPSLATTSLSSDYVQLALIYLLSQTCSSLKISKLLHFY